MDIHQDEVRRRLLDAPKRLLARGRDRRNRVARLEEPPFEVGCHNGFIFHDQNFSLRCGHSFVSS